MKITKVNELQWKFYKIAFEQINHILFSKKSMLDLQFGFASKFKFNYKA